MLDRKILNFEKILPEMHHGGVSLVFEAMRCYLSETNQRRTTMVHLGYYFFEFQHFPCPAPYIQVYMTGLYQQIYQTISQI